MVEDRHVVRLLEHLEHVCPRVGEVEQVDFAVGHVGRWLPMADRHSLNWPHSQPGYPRGGEPIPA